MVKNQTTQLNIEYESGTLEDPAYQIMMQKRQQAAEEARGTVHVVKKGETLGVIARKYRISLKKLYSLNGLTEKDARRIQPGRELKVGE